MEPVFNPISKYSSGVIFELLNQSYAGLLKERSGYWLAEREKWRQLEKEAFENPETVGRCFFITSCGGETIGMFSYDPRQRPEYGIIGQNCILPTFRGRGFGTKQILRVIEIFRKERFLKAKATTSEHPFFIPAQKMYRGLGFKEIAKREGGPDPRYGLIDLEMILL